MMLPLTILVSQKLANLLTAQDALKSQINTVASATGVTVPAVAAGHVVLSSAGQDVADKNSQLSYPRVCVYAEKVKNNRVEKFRSLSGSVAVVAHILASGNLLSQTDQWIHYYVEGVTNLLRENIGDWGDGVFFSGAYDVQFQPPKAGGFGYVQAATVTCNLNVSRN